MKISTAVTVVALYALVPASAAAQAPVKPAAGKAAANAVVKAPVAADAKCMRLPLSDIAFERDPTIAQTRMRLGEYAEAERQKRGWGVLTKSRETIECDVYLVVPFLGTEYKCLITATFCAK